MILDLLVVLKKSDKEIIDLRSNCFVLKHVCKRSEHVI